MEPMNLISRWLQWSLTPQRTSSNIMSRTASSSSNRTPNYSHCGRREETYVRKETLLLPLSLSSSLSPSHSLTLSLSSSLSQSHSLALTFLSALTFLFLTLPLFFALTTLCSRTIRGVSHFCTVTIIDRSGSAVYDRYLGDMLVAGGTTGTHNFVVPDSMHDLVVYFYSPSPALSLSRARSVPFSLSLSLSLSVALFLSASHTRARTFRRFSSFVRYASLCHVLQMPTLGLRRERWEKSSFMWRVGSYSSVQTLRGSSPRRSSETAPASSFPVVFLRQICFVEVNLILGERYLRFPL